jgi:hypothetical protein
VLPIFVAATGDLRYCAPTKPYLVFDADVLALCLLLAFKVQDRVIIDFDASQTSILPAASRR